VTAVFAKSDGHRPSWNNVSESPKSNKLREIEMTTHTAEILHLLIQESQGCGRATSHENK